MKSLLDQAKETKTKRSKNKGNSDFIELCVAWAKDEVSLTQVCAVLKVAGSGAYLKLAQGLKEYVSSLESDKVK